MSTKKKFLLAICSILLALCLTISIVLNYFSSLNPESTVYPASLLSDSIFDSQNTSYVQNESLTNAICFENIPYTYDSPNVDAAAVENGRIYKLAEEVYLYATEYPKSSPLEGVIAHEIGQVLLMDIDETQSIIRLLSNDTGFINGYESKYIVDKLTVSNGTERVSCNILGYELVIPNTSENVFMAVVSTRDDNTSAFKNLMEVEQSFLYTFQYSADLDEIQMKARAEAAQVAASEQSALEKEQREMWAQEDALRQEEEENRKYMAANLTQDYKDLQLTVYWTNTAKTPEITLYNPERTVSFKPAERHNGQAIFRVGNATQGTWILEFYGTNYGDCSMEQVEMVQGDSEASTEAVEPTSTNERTTEEYISEDAPQTVNIAL